MKEYDVSQVLDNYLKLPEVFKFYGYEINNAGFSKCPFHLEKSASCKVNDYQYHCFGCDARGNAITFVKTLFNLSFKDAVAKLNTDFCLGLLDRELSAEQKASIKKRQIDIYKSKQEEIDFEERKQDYYDAWKKVIIYSPEEKDYNINTPDYLVDKFFESVDPRYWEALSKIEELKTEAYIGNYLLDFELAKIYFTM